MFRRNFRVLLAMVAVCSVLLVACKKDNGDTDTEPKECKSKPVGAVFSEIPNLGFEEWYTGRSAGLNAQTYYNPSPSEFWASPNSGSGDLGVAKVPIVVFRVGGDSARTGYALMLKTAMGSIGTKSQLIAGSVASGDFEITIDNPLNSLKFGKKFDRRPKSVSGYYKYFPVNGDSASVYCFVTKYDANCKLDTLGIGRQIFYTEQSEYAKFEFDLEYKNTDKPDRVVIYFSSSEAGDEFKGQPGNTLYIDDVEVEYHN